MVNVTSNVDGATVKVNGREVGKTPVRVALDRKIDHELEVSKPGFESAFQSAKGETDLAILANGAPAPFLLGYGLVLLSSTSESDQNLGIALFYSSIFASGALTGIDYLTGGMREFEKSFHFELTPLPPELDPQALGVLELKPVRYLTPDLERIGGYHDKKKYEYSQIRWAKELKVNEENLQKRLKLNLSKFGYNLIGERNARGELVQVQQPDYHLEAEVKSMEYNGWEMSNGERETECSIKINWHILDPETGNSLLTIKNIGHARMQVNGGEEVFFKAFKQAAYLLMLDKRFRELLAQKEEKQEVEPTPPKQDSAPQPEEQPEK